MAGYSGDIALEQTIDIKFPTTSAATGAPTVLAGSPVISAYIGNSTTQITAGITLTVDFDGVVGYNNVRVVATAANGYTAQTDVSLCITTGTVGGTSAVGYEVGSFSIANRAAIRPTVAGRTLDVTATGAAGVDWANVENPTTALNLSGTNIDTDQVVASVAGAVGSVTGLTASDVGAIKTQTDKLTFTVANVLDANTLRVGGTVQTARDIGLSVLLSSGTGTGQVKLASGYVAPNWGDVGNPTTTVGLTNTTVGIVTLANTLTTYTGNTPQTGDSYARIGVAGVGLTNLGDTRIANLDALVSSRMATYTQPSGFLAATFPSGTIANTTNITGGVITTVTTLTNAPADSTGVTTLLSRIGGSITISGGIVSADIKKVNAVTVTGTGVLGDEWGP